MNTMDGGCLDANLVNQTSTRNRPSLSTASLECDVTLQAAVLVCQNSWLKPGKTVSRRRDTFCMLKSRLYYQTVLNGFKRYVKETHTVSCPSASPNVLVRESTTCWSCMILLIMQMKKKLSHSFCHIFFFTFPLSQGVHFIGHAAARLEPRF